MQGDWSGVAGAKKGGSGSPDEDNRSRAETINSGECHTGVPVEK